MANLSGQNIGTNYKGILNLNTLNGNLSSTLQAVTDGDGNASPLRLSTTAANIATPFTVGTMSGSVWNVFFDMTSGTNPGGYMNWKLANDANPYYQQYMGAGFMNFLGTGSGYNYGLRWYQAGIELMRTSTTGSNPRLGIRHTDPTAYLHLGAGTATANTAPLKLTSGTNLTTPENGAFEFDGTNLYFTTGGTRKTVTLI